MTTGLNIIMNSVFRSGVILLLIFSLGCFVNAYCQNPQIDSLNRLLKVKREVPVLCELAIENIAALQLADEEKAASHIKEAFDVCANHCSEEIKTEVEHGLGLVDYHLHQLEESRKHYTLSYELACKSKNQHYQSENLISLGRIALKSGDLQGAEKLLKNAEAIAYKAGYNQPLINIYKELFKLYSLNRVEKKEIFYLKKYVYLSDSLISLDLVKNVAAIQSRFDELEHLKNIKALEENIVLKNEAIARQQLLNIVLGSVAVLLVIIGILIYRLYALRNKSNQQLDIKVKQRMQQLEEGQTHLQGVLNEQKLFIGNMRDEMRALMATLKGAAFDPQQMIYHSAVAKLNLLIERIHQKGAASSWTKVALGFAFVFIIHTSVFSQQINQIRFDSIKAHFPGKTIQDRQYLMHAMAYELFDVDNSKAKRYADTAWLFAKQLGDSFKIVKTGRLRGQLLRRTERLNEAIAQFQQILPIAQRHHFVQEEKYTLNALGGAYYFKAVYDSTLEVGFRSLQLREEEGDRREIAGALNNIGVVYYKISDYEQATLFFQRAIGIYNEIHETQGMGNVLINLSLCYIYLKDYDQADKLVNNVLRICKGACSNDIVLKMEQCRGISFLYRKKYKEAIAHLKRSYALAKDSNDIAYQLDNLLFLGQVAIEEKEYKYAQAKLDEVLFLSKQFGYNQVLSNVYFEFSRLSNKTGDFKKAAYFQDRYISLKDSMFDARMIRNLAQVQIAYSERENLKLIRAQNENLTLKEEAIDRQKFLNFTLLAASCLIAVIGVLIYRLYVQRNQSNKQLDDKVRQRTKQLEEGQTQMQAVLQEQHLFIENIHIEMKALTATLKGLSLIGKQGIEEESKFLSAAGISNRLEAMITRIEKKSALMQEIVR